MITQPKTRPRIVIDLDSVSENYRIIKSKIGAAEIGCVVKADGYGLGAIEISKALERQGCQIFFAAHVEEAMALRKILPRVTLWVLHGFMQGQEETFNAFRLSPVLSSAHQLRNWQESALTLPYALHFDTGLCRIGIPESEIGAIAGTVSPSMVISHLACSDDATDAKNREQLERFRLVRDRFPGVRASLASSGGCFLGREYSFDLVRPGIALYGGNPGKSGKNPMSGVANLSAPLLQVRSIDSGESVGYGATYTAIGQRQLGVAALGYADGLLRSLSGRGFGVIGGIKCPIVGRVSMDLVTLDVTECPPESLCPGAEVEFIGRNQSVDALAADAGTAAYEIFTRLGPRIERHYAGGHLT